MEFLITDLGMEDMILGYPWLAQFEPQFSWKDATIDTTYLPIVVRSLDWRGLQICPRTDGSAQSIPRHSDRRSRE